MIQVCEKATVVTDNPAKYARWPWGVSDVKLQKTFAKWSRADQVVQTQEVCAMAGPWQRGIHRNESVPFLNLQKDTGK